jgi:hypothetical protein
MTPEVPSQPPFSGRNRAILAREAWFQAQADTMIRKIVWLATGGYPAAMRLCLKYALPAGRGRPLPIRLPTIETPEQRQYALGQIAAAVEHGLLNTRETAALLNALAAEGARIPDIDKIRKMAKIEGSVAKAAAAIGIDHGFTISEGPVAAHAAAVRAAQAMGWPGEYRPITVAAAWDLTPELRSTGGRTTEVGGQRSEIG